MGLAIHIYNSFYLR